MRFLETERLLFRSHELADEPAFVRMHMDPEVRRYVGGRAWPLREARERFKKYLGKPTKTYGLWATVLKENDEYIGCCGLIADKGGLHLGYYLARPYWGRGLASEAAKAFVDVAFRRLRASRILADVEKGHDASVRILEKFGFHYMREEEVGVKGRIICHYELAKTRIA